MPTKKDVVPLRPGIEERVESGRLDRDTRSLFEELASRLDLAHGQTRILAEFKDGHLVYVDRTQFRIAARDVNERYDP